MTQPSHHSELTNGEASVLIAPVAGIEPEEVHEYIVIAITEENGEVRALLRTSMEDPECIEVLARAINHLIQDSIL